VSAFGYDDGEIPEDRATLGSLLSAILFGLFRR